MSNGFGDGFPDGHFAPRDVYWWLYKPGNKRKVLESLNNDFELLTNDNQRLTAYETYAALYNNRRIDPGAPMLASYDAKWAIDHGKYTRCPYNLMKQVIDEVTSRITKSQPKAKFLTHGGDADMQRQANLMERWNDSQVYELYQKQKVDRVVKDSCLYGLGALKIGKAYREDRLESYRVHPGNLYVDLQETIFESPTRIHHRRFVPKNALKIYFPKNANEIDAAGTVSDHERYVSFYGHYSQGTQDMVELIESWHLPSFEGAEDGQRVLWINNKLLQQTPYQRRSFPFAFFNWKEDPHNTFYGTGLGEDLLGVHIDCNVTINRKNTAIEFASNPHWVYRKGSVTETDITNAPGTKIPFTGDVAPQFIMPPSVPSDLVQEIREYEARAYKIAGLASALGAGERVPSGLETGRAVESYFSVEQVPFSEQLKKSEYFVQDVANCNVATGREIYEGNKKWSIVVPGERGRSIEVLRWKDVALDPRDESYVIRATPASALSETFASRLGEVERLRAQDPLMTRAEFYDLLQMPDVINFEDLKTSQRDNGQAMIEKALRTGEFTAPSPFMDLPQFIIDGNEEEQKAERMGLPETNIATLRRMIRRANELEQKKQLARQMQAQAGAITPAASPTTDDGVSPNSVQQPQANQQAV